MAKYRRIEVNAFRRRVTVVSGEWPRVVPEELPAHTDDEVSLNDTDVCEPVEPDSPEGQLILVEAVRSLERRLLPEAHATLCTGGDSFVPNRSTLKRAYSRDPSFVRKTWTYLVTKILRRSNRSKADSA